MRIAYLGDPNNDHTRRWVGYFAQRHTCALFCDPPVLRPIQGVEIICPPMGTLRKIAAFKIIRHPYSNNYFKAAPYAKFVSHWRPDVVHGFEALAFGYATAACNRFPTVLTPWGNDIFEWPKQSAFARHLVKKALRNVGAISTNAPGLEEFLQAEYGVDPSRVDCFSWGADLGVFQPCTEEEARAFGKRFNIPETARVVLSPRRMKPYWGIEIIAEAVPEIVRRLGQKVMVVFLRASGDLAFEAQLKEQLESSGYGGNVRFIQEKLTPGDMAAAFTRAEVFVSIPQTDLLSSTLIEGMACGCVPVVADLPLYHARVTEGENGFYVPERTSSVLAATIERAMEDKDLRHAISQRNVELAKENDNWQVASARMEALYRRVMEKK